MPPLLVLGPRAQIRTKITDTKNFDLGFIGTGDNPYIDDNTLLALGDDGSTNIVQNVSKFGQLKLNTKNEVHSN